MSPLIALEQKARDEIERTEAIAKPWLTPCIDSAGNRYSAVTIVGAGLGGLGAAFGLMRRGIRDFRVIDERPKGFEGPWITTARMKTLRSPKHLASIDLGVPSLTMRSWFEAVYGAEAWAALVEPSKEDWMRYLVWFRDAMGIPVENDTRLVALAPAERGLKLTLRGPAGETIAYTERLVLATGMDGNGGPYIPPEIAALPRDFYTHSGDIADDGHLAGKDVVVIGGATSSFDWAVTALEGGAKSVTQLARSPDIAITEILAWTNFPGFLGHLGGLSMEDRWRFMHAYFGFKIPPTQDQYDRATSFANYRLITGTGANTYHVEAGRLRIENAKGSFVADHLLLATGYTNGPGLRPELAALNGHHALWRDVYTPPEGMADRFMAEHPYVGPGFELTPLGAGDEWVSRVHLFNAAAVPSLGPIANGITGSKYGIPRVVDALVGHLFADHKEDFYDQIKAFDAIHFDPEGRAVMEEKAARQAAQKAIAKEDA